MKQHTYAVHMHWTGNDGQGTESYRSYRRDHVVQCEGKPELPGSSDPAFRGDRTRYNPEELLVAALSSCHMLSYLHMCAVNGVVVLAYEDSATGTMQERPDSSGVFTRVVLRPHVTVTAASDPEKARELHHLAHEKCFIASSVNFPVENEPEIVVASDHGTAAPA